MQIVCATPQAAAQVLEILYAARLQTARDFTIQPVLTATPPLIFTILTALPTRYMTKIRALADTTIAE